MIIDGNAIANRKHNQFQADSFECREENCVSCPDYFGCFQYGTYEDDYSYNCEKECFDCKYNCIKREEKHE